MEDLPVAKDGHAFNLSSRVTEFNNDRRRYLAERRFNDFHQFIHQQW